MNGWIKLPRSIINHWLWQDAERFKWWCDLLMLAAWEDKKTMHDAHLFVLAKGQMIASVSFLAERWGKSAPTIIKYLKLLEDEGMIKRSVLYRQTSIITICKYESYTEQENTTLYTQVDSQVNSIVDGIVYTNKENKEYKESKEEKNTLTCIQKPKEVAEKNIVPPTLDMVRARCLTMHYTFDPEAFHAYYETRGWMLNNRKKMKDWWSACVTWQKNDTQRRKNNPSENNEDKNEQIIRQTYEILNENKARAEAGYYDDTRLPF